jgi:hypothetical protein
LGALIVFIPFIIVILHNKKDCSTPGPSDWNASDYQSNSDYYRDLTSESDFSQTDNLRLDRLSWPRFCPGDGSKIIYLRKQYHMPDLKGSSTTLHWADVSNTFEPKIVQLTRPIWGINDQQVKTKKTQQS